MLSESRSFFENGNLNFAERAACFVVFLYQIGELDRSGESCRSASHENHIHRDRFSIERLANYQPVTWKRRLKLAWNDAQCASFAHLVSLSSFAHRCSQRWNHLERIADNSIIRHFEDRRILVLVDRDDRSRRAHAGEVLDRA